MTMGANRCDIQDPDLDGVPPEKSVPGPGDRGYYEYLARFYHDDYEYRSRLHRETHQTLRTIVQTLGFAAFLAAGCFVFWHISIFHPTWIVAGFKAIGWGFVSLCAVVFIMIIAVMNS
jgi:hypothetical protein